MKGQQGFGSSESRCLKPEGVKRGITHVQFKDGSGNKVWIRDRSIEQRMGANTGRMRETSQGATV